MQRAFDRTRACRHRPHGAPLCSPDLGGLSPYLVLVSVRLGLIFAVGTFFFVFRLAARRVLVEDGDDGDDGDVQISFGPDITSEP